MVNIPAGPGCLYAVCSGCKLKFVMSYRIDIELTSARDDGMWTWRAAGARQPKGLLDARLLYEGAGVGDVVKAEVESGLDGIEVITVLPPKPKRDEPEKIILLSPKRDGVSRSKSRDTSYREEGGTSSKVLEHSKPEATSPPRRGDSKGPRKDRLAARGKSRPKVHAEESTTTAPTDEVAGSEDTQSVQSTSTATRRQPRRVVPGRRHRKELLNKLPVEQRPIAEQLLRGGIPAVRQAIEQQNEALRKEGRPEISPEPLLAMAETLWPQVNSATWLDRAEAVLRDPSSVGMRDLRAIVASAGTVILNETGRKLASELRSMLEERVSQRRQRWLEDISHDLEEGAVLRALKRSSRPPDGGARFPAELALRLAEAAGQAMNETTPAPVWRELLEAVLTSPVRRTVKPVGLPVDADQDLKVAARGASGQIPALASLLGIAMPPPPHPPKISRTSK